MPAIDWRAVGGRHVDGVDQILDRDRDAVQRTARRLGVAPPGGSESLVAVEVFPGADHRLALLDAVEAGIRQGFGGDPAVGELPGGFPCAEGAEVGHPCLQMRFWET